MRIGLKPLAVTGQGKCKPAASFRAACNGDVLVMEFQYSFGDGKSQSGVAGTGLIGIVRIYIG